MKRNFLTIFALGLCASLMAATSVVETFNNLTFATSDKSIDGEIATWTISNVQHGKNTKLKNGSYALQLSAKNAYITSTNLEGGIKSVSFLWNKATKGDNTVAFCVAAGTVTDSISQPVVTGATWNFDPDSTYLHAFNVKSNAQLSITNTTTCNMSFGYITIEPYLLYTQKQVVIAVSDFDNVKYTNNVLINNTDAGEITYSIIEGSSIASINSTTGELTITGAGLVIVQAAWEDVTTSYTLTVKRGVNETFKNQNFATTDATVEGVVATWTNNNAQHANTTKLDNKSYAVSIGKSGSLKTATNLEGGVKSISFLWNKTAKGTKMIDFTVTVDTVSKSFKNDVMGDSWTHYPDLLFNEEFAIKNSAQISISNNSTANPVQLGYIAIEPYLLYVVKDTTIYAKDLTTSGFKFKNNQLINNTESGEIAYSVLAKDGVTAIVGDSVSILGQGTDTIQASWEGVKTTYVVHVVMEQALLDVANVDTFATTTDLTFQQTITKATTATLVYSIEGTAGTTSIDQDGTVHFTEAGVLTITAKVAQELPYLADSVSYTLTINRAKPEISFAQDTVNKLDNDSAFIILPTTTVGIGDTTFISLNERVATVNATTGKVTIVGTGEATIKAQIAQNGVYEAAEASYLLVVKAHPTGLNDQLSDSPVVRFNKVVKNGQLLIVNEGQTYNAQGTLVK